MKFRHLIIALAGSVSLFGGVSQAQAGNVIIRPVIVTQPAPIYTAPTRIYYREHYRRAPVTVIRYDRYDHGKWRHRHPHYRHSHYRDGHWRR